MYIFHLFIKMKALPIVFTLICTFVLFQVCARFQLFSCKWLNKAISLYVFILKNGALQMRPKSSLLCSTIRLLTTHAQDVQLTCELAIQMIRLPNNPTIATPVIIPQ